MPDEAPQDTPAPPPPAPEPGKSAHHLGRPELPSLRFIDELKRRNVGRVAILYVVVGYVALEVFEVFFHLLDMPAWAGRVAVLVMAVGFPLVLIFAWAYEVTPEGLKPTQEVAPHQSIRHLTGRRLDRAIIAVLAIALSYFVIDKFWISNHRTAVKPAALITALTATNAPRSAIIPDKSVAVLPFVDMSEKKDQEYFADGLTEELIDRLTRIPGLRVPARTSSFYFKGKPMPITQIARDLGVANIVEGSVRKAGNMVRVTAQLIRADTGDHAWSVTYDRPRQEIFKTQDSIAKAIAGALRVTISDKVNYGGYETSSPEAFDLYLQAVSQSQRTWSTDDIQHRLALAKRTVFLDPTFSLGWITVAHLSTMLAWKAGASNDQLAEQTRHALKMAEEAGYPSVTACMRTAEAHMIFDFDGRGAVAAYRKGSESSAGGEQGSECAYALSMLQGNTAQAVKLARKAVELDPYGEGSWFDLASALYANGQSSDAEAANKRDLELDPEDESTMNLAAYILMAVGKPQDALAMANRIEKSPEWRMEVLPFIYDALGRKADSGAALDDLIRRFGSVKPVSIAGFYAKTRNDDQAFVWLQRAYAERNTNIWDIQSDPNLKSIRGDARYSTLLRQLGLIE